MFTKKMKTTVSHVMNFVLLVKIHQLIVNLAMMVSISMKDALNAINIVQLVKRKQPNVYLVLETEN